MDIAVDYTASSQWHCDTYHTEQNSVPTHPSFLYENFWHMDKFIALSFWKPGPCDNSFMIMTANRRPTARVSNKALTPPNRKCTASLQGSASNLTSNSSSLYGQHSGSHKLGRIDSSTFIQFLYNVWHCNTLLNSIISVSDTWNTVNTNPLSHVTNR